MDQAPPHVQQTVLIKKYCAQQQSFRNSVHVFNLIRLYIWTQQKKTKQLICPRFTLKLL